MSNSKFDEIKAKHPEWSDEQIWTAVSIDMQTDQEIESKGEDVDPNDPDILKSILSGAKQWLEEVLPQIFEKVKALFDKLLDTITTWVKKGLEYVKEVIDIFFKQPIY